MLEKSLIFKVIDQLMSNKADFADVFVEKKYRSNIYMTDSKIENSLVGNDLGVGLRAIYGGTTIYAYTNDLSEKSLMETAKIISLAYEGNKRNKVINLTKKEFPLIHKIKIKSSDVDKNEKVDFLRKVNKYTRRYNKLITQVDAVISEWIQEVQIANSEGLLISDFRNYTRPFISAIASNGNDRQTGLEASGRLKGFEFIRELDPKIISENVAETAIKMLKANYAPSGNFPVVIDNGFGGVIFHEACGHSLETTSIQKNSSVFCGKMGEQIASTVVTAIDDGTLENQWGSSHIDDEGMETQKTVLIENGILKSYMVDRMGEIKTGFKRTGSGRRESYAFAPASRMRNTYIAAGPHKLDDLISSIDYGIYAKKMGGGSVNPGTGEFNFNVSEGYLVKNGKIAEPLRGATLIGNGAETLMKISMVADNLMLGEGMCGSVSGSIPVCVGQPAIKVDQILVGGRENA